MTTAVAISAHVVSIRNLAATRWEARCSCGWQRAPLRWAVSARDANAAHLLAVQS